MSNNFNPLNPLNISDAVNNALKNSSDKPSKVIAQIICDILAIPASRIRDFAMIKASPNSVSAEIFSQNIFEGISSIPDDKITKPETQIIGQAIEDSTYCIEHEELRSLFESLIINSCNLDYSKFIHPSFSNTLKCMSPYDAILFQKIATIVHDTGRTVDAASYIVLTEGTADFLLVHECIIFTDEYFKDFNMQSLSISALKQLGLITHTDSEPISVDEKFTNNIFFQNLNAKYADTKSYPVARYAQINLTPYGEALANVCLNYPSKP
ncbi:MAG: DUF4393 domain-containing protein [Lachnospiraceae bacterium]|nr:DUF4393 domain-containing protein [Lachnospiraceae bacterium]